MNKRTTRALIYRENLKFNLAGIRSLLKPGTAVCAAVKADGYGHGAVEVSRTLLDAGVETLGVSAVCEGGELREEGIEAPILLFGHAAPEELEDLCRWNIQPFAGSPSYLKALETEARRQDTVLDIHLKIDTGMGRIGCRPSEAVELAWYISNAPNLNLKGTCTHFPVSDSPDPKQKEFMVNQIGIFRKCVDEIRAAGIDPGLVHAANSGAIAAWPEAHFDMIRPGIILYGYYPDAGMEKPIPLKPVMQFETALTIVKKVSPGTTISYGRTWTAEKECWIGTMPAGYADGYNRLLSNRADVMIEGERFPLAGRICMDQTMVDLGSGTDEESLEKPPFAPGQKVVLFGPDPHGPSAEELGLITGTIPYEVTCAVSRRVPRVYI